MILAALVASAFPGRFAELQMPEALAGYICIVAPTPAFGARDRAISRVLAKVLLEGTEEFSKRQLRDLTLGSGQSLRCTVMPDHIRVDLGFSRGDLATGLVAAQSIIEHALLPEEAVDSALETLPFAKSDYWSLALQPEIADYAGIRRQDVVDMYRQLFKAERLSIAVSGPYARDRARDQWERLYEGWRSPFMRPMVPGVGPEKGLMPASQPITTLELAGPEIKGRDPRLPAELLAVFALGAGKDSAVFRILRERMRISYRQEALLWPTANGFRPRVLLAVRPSSSEIALADSAKAALLEDVASWDAATRARALAMAETVYLRGLKLNPMQLQVGGNVGLGQADRTFLAAYWPLKAGRAWDEAEILKSLRAVSLDDMRSIATEFLSASSPRIISGR